MKRNSSKSRFPYLLWHYTTATENLFDLTHEELFIFKLIVEEASK